MECTHGATTNIAPRIATTARVAGVALLLGLCIAAAHAAWAQSDVDSMPKGGRTLLLQVLGSPLSVAELERIAASKHTEEEWSQLLASRTAELRVRQRKTLAAYLAVTMPLSAGALEKARADGDVTKALPPDGRDVAASMCQTACHSLVTVKVGNHGNSDEYKDWLLKEPRHQPVTLTAPQLEILAHYAAINLPAY